MKRGPARESTGKFNMLDDGPDLVDKLTAENSELRQKTKDLLQLNK